MYKVSWSERLRFAVGLPLSIIYFPIMLATVVAYALMPRAIAKSLQAQDRAKEVAARIAAIKAHVSQGEEVLDVGAGSGDFLKSVRDAIGVRIRGIDIIDYSDDDVDVLMFDGTSIPLPDKSVDVSMAAFVLHHTRDQSAIVSEMIRVSRRLIVIYEDTYFTPWQRVFVAWNDYYANILMGSVRAFKALGKFSIVSMPMPFTFRTVRGWQEFFLAHGLTLVATQVRHSKIKPMSKVAFVIALPDYQTTTAESV